MEKIQLSIAKSIMGEIEYQRVFADLEKDIAKYLKSSDRRQSTLQEDWKCYNIRFGPLAYSARVVVEEKPLH